MDEALVEVLRGLDEVRIALLELASLNRMLLLIALLVCLYQLAVTIIDSDMTIPEMLLAVDTDSEEEVEEYDVLAGKAHSGRGSVGGGTLEAREHHQLTG